MNFTYENPRPTVTVDTILLRFRQSALEILLVQRGHPPFRAFWALPGGFIEMEEKLIESAKRELKEETNLNCEFLIPLHFAGDPGRDPRGRTITCVFGGILSPPFSAVQAGDDARKAKWFRLKNLPKLAFDHQKIIEMAMAQLKLRAFWQLWIFAFLPDTFDHSDLELIFSELFGSTKYLETLLKTAQNLCHIEIDPSGHIKQNMKITEFIELDFDQCRDAWLMSSNKCH
jgi:8-oxo-dGTP diphosphatase